MSKKRTRIYDKYYGDWEIIFISRNSQGRFNFLPAVYLVTIGIDRILYIEFLRMSLSIGKD